jgi:lysophospholipase L1-like esterase
VNRPFAVVVVVAWTVVACAKQEAPREEAKGEGASVSVSPSAGAGAGAGAGASASASASAVASAAPPPDTLRKGTTVVHIGDSFTEAYFEQNLRARVSGVGAKYLVKAQTPSYTPTWAFGGYDGALDTLLNTHPGLVLITLGANEVDMKQPEQHAKAVKELARKAGQWGQCVWITPPMWKKDSGFLEVIRQNCAPCAYWNSDEHVQDIARQKDGIHPNEAGGAKWAAAFWDWLEASRDPSKGAWRLKDQ